MSAPLTAEALVAALNREPIELADGVTPEEVMRLALDGIDIAYRAHGESARVSLLAVQADWIMQHLAKTEAWAKDEQAKRHAAEDKLVEARSHAALAEAALATATAEAARLRAEVEALKGALTEIAADAGKGALCTFKASFKAWFARIEDTARTALARAATAREG